MSKLIASGLAAFLLATGTTSLARATNFVVTTTADSYVEGDGVCSLREAVDTANYNDCWTDCGCTDGNWDTVTLKSGATYTLNQQLEIFDMLALYGNGAIIRAASSAVDFYGIRIKWVPYYVEVHDVTLENFRLAALLIEPNTEADVYGLGVRYNTFRPQNGQNASVAVMNGALLYLYKANIHHNTDNIKGGGLFIDANAWVDLRSSLIQNNKVSQFGGGVHNQGHLRCYGGTTISGNSAVYGGGGVHNTTSGVFDGSSGCTVTGNTSTSGGANIGGHP